MSKEFHHTDKGQIFCDKKTEIHDQSTGLVEAISQLPQERQGRDYNQMISVLRLCRIGPYLDTAIMREILPDLPGWARIITKKYLSRLGRYGPQAIQHLQLPLDLEWKLSEQMEVHTIGQVRDLLRRQGRWVSTRRYHWARRNLEEWTEDEQGYDTKLDNLPMLEKKLREFDALTRSSDGPAYVDG